MLTIIHTSRRLNAYVMIPGRSIDLPRKGRAPVDGRTLPRRLRRYFEPTRGTGSRAARTAAAPLCAPWGRFGSLAGPDPVRDRWGADHHPVSLGPQCTGRALARCILSPMANERWKPFQTVISPEPGL